MKRILTAILALLVILTIPALGQSDEESKSLIPVPKGANITLEMSATREQLLLQIDFLVSQMVATSSDEINVAARIKDALGTLKELQLSIMETRADSSLADMLAFFEKEVGGKRLLYNIEPVLGGAFLALSKPEDGGLFIAKIDPIGDERDKRIPEYKIQAVRFVGSPDLVKLAKLVGELAKNDIKIGSSPF